MMYRGRYVIIGPPGTGKTTFLARQVEKLLDTYAGCPIDDFTSPIIACSLTRTAAAEFAQRRPGLPRNAIGTLHALAYRLAGDRRRVAEAHLDEWNKYAPEFAINARVASDDEEDAGNDAYDMFEDDGTSFYAEYQLQRARCTDRSAWPSTVAAFARRWEDWKSATGYIDYTDMLERALRVNAVPLDARVLLIDEAQDMSALEWRLIAHWEKMLDAVFVAGDPWQALYTWRGAAPRTMEEVPPDRRRILHQSYRVPRAVHAAAMRWIRNLSWYSPIEYRPRPDDGRAYRCGATLRRAYGVPQLIEELLRENHDVMLLATCGYMLAPVCAELRDNGIWFANKWRVKSGAWNPIRPGGTYWKLRDILSHAPWWPVANERRECWTPTHLHMLAQLVRAEVFARGVKDEVEGWAKDKATCDAPLPAATLRNLFATGAYDEMTTALAGGWNAIARWMDRYILPSKRSSITYPLAVLRRNPEQRSPRVWVGTVHSVKGGEADAVVLWPDLSRAGMEQWVARDRDSIVHTVYVGMTRARRTLMLGAPSGAYSVEIA